MDLFEADGTRTKDPVTQHPASLRQTRWSRRSLDRSIRPRISPEHPRLCRARVDRLIPMTGNNTLTPNRLLSATYPRQNCWLARNRTRQMDSCSMTAWYHPVTLSQLPITALAALSARPNSHPNPRSPRPIMYRQDPTRILRSSHRKELRPILIHGYRSQNMMPPGSEVEIAV